jgi:hypothetical protein
MNAVDRAVAGREKFALLILGTAQFLLANADFVALLGLTPPAAAALGAALVPLMGYLTPNSTPVA